MSQARSLLFALRPHGAFATHAIAVPLLLSGLSLRTPLISRDAPLAADTSTANVRAMVDTTPLRLNEETLQRLTVFMAQLRHHPAHLRALAADSANYGHVPRRVGPFQFNLIPLPGAGTLDALLDFGALAPRDPVVAAAFRQARLAPALYLPLATALQSALGTDAADIMGATRLTQADSTTVLWQNVAFLRTHRRALDRLALPMPPVELAPLDSVWHFLDTTQHARHIRVVEASNDLSEPWPWGYEDSTEAPSSTSAPPFRVLFIGNSLTYVNSMPKLFSAVAAVGLKRRVVVGLVSLPGATPFGLWAQTDLREVLAVLPWDAVVVQLKPADNDQGTLAQFPYFTHLFTQAITARHARAVFWTEWGSPPGLQKKSRDVALGRADSLLSASATAFGAGVVPVPQLFAEVRRQQDSTWRALFRSAVDPHPSALGSYLQALILYKTLTGRSPIGLPRAAHVRVALPHPHGSPPGFQMTDSLMISARTARFLQHIVATAGR